MTDRPNPMRLGNQWHQYAEHMVPPDAHYVQKVETRRAFYAGAASMLAIIMSGLGPGEEANQSDLMMMDQLNDELVRFKEDVQHGRA